jgi:hypothetical protein
MFKLHYASLDLGNNDIPCFEFQKHSQMIDFIDEKCINRNGQVVWLLAKKDSTDIFISENHLSIKMIKWFEINLGWFFINGRKQQQWNEYLKQKYGR